MGLRVSLEEEIIGADIVEHGIGSFESLSSPLSLPNYLNTDQCGICGLTTLVTEHRPKSLKICYIE